MKLQIPKGTRDFPPEEKIVRDKIVETIKNCFELYGYSPLETPALERYEVLASKFTGGDEILKVNRKAVQECDSIYVIWDGVSFGTVFDMGMAYGLEKPIFVVDVIPQSWTTYAMGKKGKFLEQGSGDEKNIADRC